MTQLQLMRDANYTNPELAEVRPVAEYSLFDVNHVQQILRKSGPGQKVAPTADIPALRKMLLDMNLVMTAANEDSSQRSVKETDHRVDIRDKGPRATVDQHWSGSMEEGFVSVG